MSAERAEQRLYPLATDSALEYTMMMAGARPVLMVPANYQQKFVHDWIGKPQETNPQTAQELADYLENRPKNRKYRSVITQHFMSSEQFHYEKTLLEQVTDDQRSLYWLVKERADATERQDRTRVQDINEAITDRLQDAQFSVEDKDMLIQGLVEMAERESQAGEQSVVSELPLPGRTHDGLRSSVALVRTKARLGLQRANEYLTDEEKGRRRKIAAGFIGVFVLVGGAVLVFKGLSSGGGAQHGSTVHEATGNGVAGPSGTGGGEAGLFGMRDIQHVIPAGNSPSHHPPTLPTSVRLKPGGTIWQAAVRDEIRHGHLHPSNARTVEHVRHLLHINHLSWLQAHHLVVGTKIKLV